MNDTENILRITRTFNAPRDRVFEAWTRVTDLKKWWGMDDSFTTPIAEVDLRVGGAYRLAMKPPDSDDLYIVGGTFREVMPPKRLVYTWAWEGTGEAESLVTVEFHDRNGITEVVLTHGAFADQARRDEHAAGWEGCLNQLTKLLAPTGK